MRVVIPSYLGSNLSGVILAGLGALWLRCRRRNLTWRSLCIVVGTLAVAVAIALDVAITLLLAASHPGLQFWVQVPAAIRCVAGSPASACRRVTELARRRLLIPLTDALGGDRIPGSFPACTFYTHMVSNSLKRQDRLSSDSLPHFVHLNLPSI
jgi:uncharacterized membrane protein YfcA